MTILSYQTLKTRNIVDPWCDKSIWNSFIFGPTSYGASSCSYDVRLAQIKLNKSVIRHDDTSYYIRPHSFALASTYERFKMPFDVAAVVHDKSTLARRGLCVQNTLLDPGWHGYLTLELTNHSPDCLVLEIGMPIAQIVFHLLDEVTLLPYSGKYQNQENSPQVAR